MIQNLLKQLEKNEEILANSGFTNFVISGHTEGRQFAPWQMFDKSTIMETIKEIKGELPLPGLVERIDNYLSLMNKGKRLQFELPNH